ncbi:MAG: hypothetical protein NTV39_00340 [Candidatus Saccharibacteria bacterium]|nr:hypothetical protein [Candidatus Saccharibacteria bacterium]
MSELIPSINSKDLVVQQGPNMGYIDDASLAHIAAEAEQKPRRKNIRNKLGYLMHKGPTGDGGVGYDSQEEYVESIAGEASSEAMRKEIGRRANEATRNLDISNEAKQRISANAQWDLIKEQKAKKSERIRDEVRKSAA